MDVGDYPTCIVTHCKSSLGGVLLHAFPTKLSLIKKWLQQTGQDFGDLETFAERIKHRKSFFEFCMCSVHFTRDCYVSQGAKNTLRRDAVPTIFPNREQHAPASTRTFSSCLQASGIEIVYPRSQQTCQNSMKGSSPFMKPRKLTSNKAVQCPEVEKNSKVESWKIFHDHVYSALDPNKVVGAINLNEFFPKEVYPDWFWPCFSSRSDEIFTNWTIDKSADKVWGSIERILVLLLQHLNNSPAPERTLDNKEKIEKILNQALEIIFLLTGQEWTIVKKDYMNQNLHQTSEEIPVKCDDVAVYFSMEEWEYLDEHRENYRELLQEEHRPFNSVKLPDDWCIDDVNWAPDEPDDLKDDDDFKPEPSEDSGSSEDEEALKKRRAAKKRRKKMKANAEASSENRSEPPAYTCKACNLFFYDEDELAQHESFSLECNECGKHFSEKSNLYRHQAVEHDKKIYECDKCDKVFTRRNIYDKHQEKHSCKKSLTCDTCGRLFDYPSQLIIHQRAHTGERPYKCDECGMEFGHKCTLVVHQRMHSGFCPFSCEQCDRKFDSKKMFVRHKKLHEREANKCPDCGKSFIYKMALLKHQKTHKK
ncbi:hypothetical protein GDO86_013766 [Hymenochirus boettgeri]|uniref:Uncharacterized protein n=1 Tax=Hymenochirus boettgeri TaxID=247094 RepID=A0A8T2JR10_9PIPI|nr:hypothetical protein GDO86_013766 [Hymenochirus boettgeri]KAG8446014.1 hypothetical protein GDO86_013766 [Hymenochirus boettgeri]